MFLDQRSPTLAKLGALASAAGLSQASTGVPPTELLITPIGTLSF